MSDPVWDGTGNLNRTIRSSQDLLALAPSAEELLADEIDGELYAYKRERMCRVCSADPDLAKLIDTLLLYPKSYREVLELATPLMDAKGMPPDRRPSYNSIRHHQKKHLPFDKLAVREIVERRARERAISILGAKDRILTYEAILETVVHKGFARLVDGHLEPTLTETLNAASRLDALEKAASGSLSLQDLLAQLNIILGAVREEVPVEYWDRVVERIQIARQAMAEGNEPIEVTAGESTSHIGEEYTAD